MSKKSPPDDAEPFPAADQQSADNVTRLLHRDQDRGDGEGDDDSPGLGRVALRFATIRMSRRVSHSEGKRLAARLDRTRHVQVVHKGRRKYMPLSEAFDQLLAATDATQKRT